MCPTTCGCTDALWVVFDVDILGAGILRYGIPNTPYGTTILTT